MTPAPGAPLVSFGIPAYRRPALLAETLASIAAQTAALEYEVVVCDDGDDPATPATVARFPSARFFYFRNPRPLGAVGNWNECLRRARGRWVMILHEDDTLYPWYLATVHPYLGAGVAAVATRVVRGATPPALARPRGPVRARDYRPRYFIKGAMTPFPGVLFPRALADDLGGFSAAQGPLADYDFWYRLAGAGRIRFLDTVGAFYRLDPAQWTTTAWPRMLRLAHLLRLRIAREQFRSPAAGRWLARFFSYRDARSYARRFGGRPAALQRALRLGRIPGHRLPSGWVWLAIKWSS